VAASWPGHRLWSSLFGLCLESGAADKSDSGIKTVWCQQTRPVRDVTGKRHRDSRGEALRVISLYRSWVHVTQEASNQILKLFTGKNRHVETRQQVSFALCW